MLRSYGAFGLRHRGFGAWDLPPVVPYPVVPYPVVPYPVAPYLVVPSELQQAAALVAPGNFDGKVAGFPGVFSHGYFCAYGFVGEGRIVVFCAEVTEQDMPQSIMQDLAQELS